MTNPNAVSSGDKQIQNNSQTNKIDEKKLFKRTLYFLYKNRWIINHRLGGEELIKAPIKMAAHFGFFESSSYIYILFSLKNYHCPTSYAIKILISDLERIIQVYDDKKLKQYLALLKQCNEESARYTKAKYSVFKDDKNSQPYDSASEINVDMELESETEAETEAETESEMSLEAQANQTEHNENNSNNQHRASNFNQIDEKQLLSDILDHLVCNADKFNQKLANKPITTRSNMGKLFGNRWSSAQITKLASTNQYKFPTAEFRNKLIAIIEDNNLHVDDEELNRYLILLKSCNGETYQYTIDLYRDKKKERIYVPTEEEKEDCILIAAIIEQLATRAKVTKQEIANEIGTRSNYISPIITCSRGGKISELLHFTSQMRAALIDFCNREEFKEVRDEEFQRLLNKLQQTIDNPPSANKKRRKSKPLIKKQSPVPSSNKNNSNDQDQLVNVPVVDVKKLFTDALLYLISKAEEINPKLPEGVAPIAKITKIGTLFNYASVHVCKLTNMKEANCPHENVIKKLIEIIKQYNAYIKDQKLENYLTQLETFNPLSYKHTAELYKDKKRSRSYTVTEEERNVSKLMSIIVEKMRQVAKCTMKRFAEKLGIGPTHLSEIINYHKHKEASYSFRCHDSIKRTLIELGRTEPYQSLVDLECLSALGKLEETIGDELPADNKKAKTHKLEGHAKINALLQEMSSDAERESSERESEPEIKEILENNSRSPLLNTQEALPICYASVISKNKGKPPEVSQLSVENAQEVSQPVANKTAFLRMDH